MKQKLVLRSLVALAAAFFTMTVVSSCKQEAPVGEWDDSVVGTATVSGVVKDTFDNLLADVDVTFMGTDTKREVRKTAKSGADGSFSVAGVPSNARYITFAKKGFATVAYTIAASRFANEDNIVLNPVLEFSEAVIKGVVYNAGDGKPWAGVKVSSGSVSVTTGADGSFSLEGLTIKDYTITYTAADGTVYNRDIPVDAFVDGVATAPDVRLGGDVILPGYPNPMRFQDLADAQIWYSNDWRGHNGSMDGYNWTCGYMSIWQSYGHYRYESEGCALVTHGGYGSRGDEDNFNAYFYGRKKIYAGNKYFNAEVRTHNASPVDPIHFGLQILNLTDGATAVEKLETKTHGSGNYSVYTYDLSKWVGKEVVIAFGIYYLQSGGDYHMPIRRVTFSSAPIEALAAPLPGTPVEGANWFGFTKENIASMTVNEKTSFTGLNLGYNSQDSFDVAPTDPRISPRHCHNPGGLVNANGGQQGYNLWTNTNHIAANWAFQSINSGRAEPVNGEGYTIKCKSNTDPNYDTPVNYLYSRFSITDANDKIHFRFRTFSSDAPTVFRVTAVPVNTGKAEALTPVSNSAKSAKATTNGCWEFVHEQGNGTPVDYAEFVYDLSKFKGQDIVIALGVYKGETRDGEQKLCIYSVDMD